jgi:thiamine biosynthesis protein ThiS
MKIQVNREIIEFSGGTVSDLMSGHFKGNINAKVVVVNNAVISKRQWELCKLREADAILIITPTEGG